MVVLGPIPIDDWKMMRTLRESIKEMQTRDREGLAQWIDTEAKMYKMYKQNIQRAA